MLTKPFSFIIYFEHVDYIHMTCTNKVDSRVLSLNPVFSMMLCAGSRPRGGRSGAVERLRHYVETGRLARFQRRVRYKGFAPIMPNCFHVRRRRSHAIFSYHSALELQAVHSIWHDALF
jgi:hypothetical protein